MEATKKNPDTSYRIVCFGAAGLLYRFASKVCTFVKDHADSFAESKCIVHLLSSNETATQVAIDGHWIESVAEPFNVTDFEQVVVLGPLPFSETLIALVPSALGAEEVENDEIRMADLVIYFDDFGNGITQEKRRIKLLEIYDEYRIIPWIVSHSEKQYKENDVARYKKIYTELFPDAPSSNLWLLNINDACEALIGNIQKFITHFAWKNRKDRFRYQQNKRAKAQSEEQLSESYVNDLLTYNIKYVQDKLKILESVIEHCKATWNGFEQDMKNVLIDMQKNFKSTKITPKDIKEDVLQHLESRMLQWRESKIVITEQGLQNFHQHLLNQLAAVDEAFNSISVQFKERAHDIKINFAELIFTSFPADLSVKESIRDYKRREILKGALKITKNALKKYVYGIDLTSEMRENQAAHVCAQLINNLPIVAQETKKIVASLVQEVRYYCAAMSVKVEAYEAKLKELLATKRKVKIPSTVLGGRKKFRILSMDGGGMRGLLLVELLYYLSVKNHAKITDSFDLICGTSTGGIIALALAFLDLPLKGDDSNEQDSLTSLEQFYWELGKEVFPNTEKGFKLPLFSAAQLTEQLKKRFENKKLSDRTSVNAKVKVFVTSTKIKDNSGQPFLFRTYDQPEHASYEGTNSFYVWEAARATSAAPIYFDEFVKDGSIYIDGGVGMNNPTFSAISEAKAILGKDFDQYDLDIVSLGTGKQTIKLPDLHSIQSSFTTDFQYMGSMLLGVDPHKLVQIFAYMIELATSSESTHEHLHLLLKNYTRINPPLKVSVDLSETNEAVLVQMLFDAACFVLP